MPLQLLSSPSQISAAAAQVGLHTPAVLNVHFHAPATHARLTPPGLPAVFAVHSPLEAVGLTPQTWVIWGTMRFAGSSIWPSQLSSAPLHSSWLEENVHG